MTAVGNKQNMRIGFDIGGTSARCVVIDNGELTFSETTPSRGWEPEDAAQYVQEHVEQHPDVDAVGVAIAAQLSADRTAIRNSPNLGWDGLSLGDCFDVDPPIYFYNDLNAALFAEAHQGAAIGCRYALGVFVGTGVGGAILHDGKLFRGARSVAGEIGHVKVSIDTSARRCGCGQRGCLEAYVGGAHLESRIRDHLPEVAKQRGVDLKRADELFEDNAAIERIWRESSNLLATAIANAVTLLNPEVLVLGGGVLIGAMNFRRMVLRNLNDRVSESAASVLEIKFAERPEFGGAIGAALLSEQE